MNYQGKHAVSKPVPGSNVRRYLMLCLALLVIEATGLWAMDRMALEDAEFKSVPVALPKVYYRWEIPDGVPTERIAVSYAGRYLAYPDGGNLIVTDLADRKVIASVPRRDDNISLLRWLPDRDRLFYAASRKDGAGSLQIRFLDAETGEEGPINEIVRRSNTSAITRVTLSSATNLVYFGVDDGAGRSRLYRLDVMGDLYRVRLKLAPRQIALLPHEDQLIVEDGLSRQVLGISGALGTDKTPLEATGATGASSAMLVGVDEKDRVYLGDPSPDGKRVVSVRRGKVGESFQTVWRGADGVPRDALLIGRDNALYAVDQRHGVILPLSGGRRRRFRGEFVSFDGRLLVTREGDRLTVDTVL